MAVNLLKPDPGENSLPDVVDLAATGNRADSGHGGTAQRPGRLQAWWERALKEAEQAADGPRTPVLRRPRLGAYSVFNRTDLESVRTGSAVIFRAAGVLARHGGILLAGAARKLKGKKKSPRARVTGDLVMGGVLLAGMGIAFLRRTVVPALAALVADSGSWCGGHLVDIAQGAGTAVIVFAVIAWITGGVVNLAQDHRTGPGTVEGVLEADREAREGGDAEAGPDDGQVPVCSPEQEAERARIQFYEWVRESITTLGNGTAVHLRELTLSAQKAEGGGGETMADVRARLQAHDITVRDQVKAPASDKGGKLRNRPGVHVADLPQAFTPVPTSGSNLIRIIPTYQGPDQA